MQGCTRKGSDTLARATRRSSTYRASRERVKRNLATRRQTASILRRAGLLKRTAAQTSPKYLSGSYFRELRRRYADVIEGSSKTTTVTSDVARALKAAGYRIKKTAADTFKVIVPAESKTRRKVSRKRAVELIQQPAPVSPKPVKPRPSRVRASAGTVKKTHSFDDCLKAVIEWFRLNKDDGYGPLQEREANLVTLAMRSPDAFRAIIRASHNDAMRYLQGKGQRWQTRLPSGVAAIDFRDYFPELFYYHPTTSTYLATGGVIPRC